MDIRAFGITGLHVPALGLGTGRLSTLSQEHATDLIDTALDLGINLIDTAPSYGDAETRLGHLLKHRRQHVILSTKVGYGIDGIDDWTGPCITAGIERALRRLQTDWLDIVHLHSCDLDILQRGDVIAALTRAVQQGHVRLAAYAGDNHPLHWTIHHGHIHSIQASFNVCDQRFANDLLWNAKQRGLGVIAKRPLANAAWRTSLDDTGTPYPQRWHTLGLDAIAHDAGIPPADMALRFVVWTWGIDSAIVGTTNADNLRANAHAIAAGPLPDDLVTVLRGRFYTHGNDWFGHT